MLRQQGHPAEGLAAGAARVLLHVAVRLEVRPEVTPVCERTVAVLAAEGLLAGVRPDVALEQPRPRERLAAEVALAGQRVRPDVHLQRAQADVHLLAVFARERLLRLALGGGAVELLVFGQAGVRRVRFSAVRTLVPRRRRRRRGRRGQRRRGTVRDSALLDLRVHDRWARRRASGGRSSAVASWRRQILRCHWWRRPQ